jgi:hypothetical protein
MKIGGGGWGEAFKRVGIRGMATKLDWKAEGTRGGGGGVWMQK